MAGLERMREAHGRREDLERPAGAAFGYRVEAAGRSLDLSAVVAFGTRPRLWIRPRGGEDPAWVALSLESAPGTLLAPGAAALESAGELSAPSAVEIEQALRALPFLFSLPLALGQGSWEYRRLLPPRSLESALARELEIEPCGGSHWVGPFLIGTEPERLGEALYISRLPGSPARVWKVTFSEYRQAGGVAVATRRLHTPLDRQPVEPPDPLALDPVPGEPPPRGVVEVLENLRLLGTHELEALAGEVPPS